MEKATRNVWRAERQSNLAEGAVRAVTALRFAYGDVLDFRIIAGPTGYRRLANDRSVWDLNRYTETLATMARNASGGLAEFMGMGISAHPALGDTITVVPNATLVFSYPEEVAEAGNVDRTTVYLHVTPRRLRALYLGQIHAHYGSEILAAEYSPGAVAEAVLQRETRRAFEKYVRSVGPRDRALDFELSHPEGEPCLVCDSDTPPLTPGAYTSGPLNG